MASRFGVDPQEASSAALLHDLCREYSPDLLLKLAAKFDIVIDSVQAAEPLLLHGLVASRLAEDELNVKNPDVLEAIAFHITGGPDISSLARLIFIADFIEPGRTCEEARRLRDQAFVLMPEKLLLEVYNCTLSFVLKKGYLIHPLSLNGRNELLLKGATR